jgi:asparagine synthase (glutamine-hydrolysing)
VKAVISGEGADELFAGYRWLANPLVDRAEALRSVFPRSVARRLATLSGRDRWRLFFDVLGADQRAGVDVIWLEHLARGRDGIVRPELRASRSELTALLPHPETLASCRDRLERRLALEMVGRLGDGVLLVGDKTSMAHSLEVRMPFLHRPLVDFALRLPADLKIRAGREKYLLSRIASRLPDEIRARKKKGLAYPAQRGADPRVRRFVTELLLESSDLAPIFDRARLERRLRDALARKDGRLPGIWPVAVLQCWWNEFFAK